MQRPIDPYSPTKWIEWKPELKAADWYKVYARWPSAAFNPTIAVYTVYHAGGSTPVTVGQLKSIGQWVPLGTYYMEPGQSHCLYLSNIGASYAQYLVADAARFVRLTGSSKNDLIVDNTDAGVSMTGTWGHSPGRVAARSGGQTSTKPTPAPVTACSPGRLRSPSKGITTSTRDGR